MEDRYFVIFGDLYEGKSPGWTKKKNEEGDIVIKLKIKPTPQTKNKFNIKDTDVDDRGYLDKEYPIEYLWLDNNDQNNERLLLSCDIDGNAGPLKDVYVNELIEQAKMWKDLYLTQMKKSFRTSLELESVQAQAEQREEEDNRRIQSKRKALGSVEYSSGPQQPGTPDVPY